MPLGASEQRPWDADDWIYLLALDLLSPNELGKSQVT